MRHLLSSMLLSLLMILTGIPALATPTTITYQGYLSTNSNAPVNTPVAMTVSLYADPTGGTALWSEHLPAVTVINGIFTVLIGSTTPINLTFNRVYYLGLAIGSDPELTPRQEMSSVPYAFRAATADKLGTVCSDGEGLRYTAFSSSWECAALSQWGTVTSVAVSGGTTGLTTSGGPVTTSGTLTLGGTLAVANGGTGATDGSITGTGVLSFTAGGSDTNIKLVPQGTGTVDVASKRITSLALPTTDSDAANKRYVDSSANVIRTGKTLSQIATLAWYTTMARTTYSVGRNPQGIAFDCW